MRFFVHLFGGRGRSVLRLSAAAAAVAAALAAAASGGADAGEAARKAAAAAMRMALSSSATWRMERTVPGTDRVFKSSGDVACDLGGGGGIVWRTLAPFASTVSMRKDAMVFEDEDGRREKPAGDMPHYEDIRKATDAFAAGDDGAFARVFDTSASALPGGRWKVVMKPRGSAARKLVEYAAIEGADLPETVVIRAANGGESRISFKRKEGDAGKKER